MLQCIPVPRYLKSSVEKEWGVYENILFSSLMCMRLSFFLFGNFSPDQFLPPYLNLQERTPDSRYFKSSVEKWNDGSMEVFSVLLLR